MNIHCRQYDFGSAEYQAALSLRTKILRQPLGLEFTGEELARDAEAFHFGAFIDDHIVGTLMMTSIEKEPEILRMRQVAVDKDVQGQGVGKALVQFAESFARQKGYGEIALHARDTAVAFYLALGYEKFGDVFFEVTIPHQEMVKVL